MLDGAEGAAVATAARILVEVAEAMGAEALIDVTKAHVDSCLYHGRAGLDFAQLLVEQGGRVRVPTTLNVGALDLRHPDLVRLEPGVAEDARALMDAYTAMGCRQTWTCAPYQLFDRPALGEQIAWAESNAIVFANSALGARTERYGDFIDICCALTGKAPFTGLHTDEGRRATISFELQGVPERLLSDELGFACVGLVVGRRAGSELPAIVGLPPSASEDHLKALGAAAASSGSVAMFHAIGLTPEAPTLDKATGGRTVPAEPITLADLREAATALQTGTDGPIGAVCLGTPHASVRELARIAALARDAGTPTVPVYVNVGRDAREEAGGLGLIAQLEASGITLVSDTCTYLTPVLHDIDGPVMTDSVKWAWYAPGNLGVQAVFGTAEECLRSAAGGAVVRDPGLWGD